jgi:protein-tyrosine-phosphatase
MAARAPKERIEFWDIDNPSSASGGRDAIMAAYREVRDDLARRLAARFKGLYHKP